MGRAIFPQGHVMKSFKIFSETTPLILTRFHMTIAWMNLYQSFKEFLSLEKHGFCGWDSLSFYDIV